MDPGAEGTGGQGPGPDGAGPGEGEGTGTGAGDDRKKTYTPYKPPANAAGTPSVDPNAGMEFMSQMMQMLMQAMGMMMTPQTPQMPQVPEVIKQPDVDWTEKQKQLSQKMKATFGLDVARRKGRLDTIHTSPLLDTEEAATTESILV